MGLVEAPGVEPSHGHRPGADLHAILGASTRFRPPQSASLGWRSPVLGNRWAGARIPTAPQLDP
jgi:hypothetical protein